MGNFKVKVNTPEESNEVQYLFEVIGYERGTCSLGSYPAIIVTTQDWATGNYCSTRALGLDIPAHKNYKETTLPELRDMVKPSLNDQYAEIEQVRQAIKVPDGNDSNHTADAMAYAFMGVGRDKVRQTLNERQSQYGDFKDVADTTQKLMATLMGNTGYSCVQVEALHMICSKLARIANGDPNHVDSWHDISGYATLVVDDLES